MTDEPATDDAAGAGCLVIIGAISMAIGVGYIWGSGIGWIVFGAACFVVVVANAVLRRKPKP